MKKRNIVIRCFVLLMLITTFVACASTRTRESTGEYVDDSVITTKVKGLLAGDDFFKSFQISVETYKGIVQLSGFVNSQQAVNKAGEIARSVKGVTSVRNNLIVKEKVIILASEPKEKVVALASEPKEKVIILAFEDVHFDLDKAILTEEAQVILKRNIQILKANPKAKVRIAGYTSASGSESYNQRLSERRANAVKEYLIKEGVIAPNRLSTIGYGVARPAEYEAAPEDLYSEAAKANMKVLFEIIVE
jgi:outer membrane protein OmpA-like peptidoglycan-associated protein